MRDWREEKGCQGQGYAWRPFIFYFLCVLCDIAVKNSGGEKK